MLLGAPIGMLLHLVWDGAFSSAKVFWWPFSGSWGDMQVPSMERGLLNIPMELIGAVILWSAWRRFGLADADRRRAFLHHGLLSEF